MTDVFHHTLPCLLLNVVCVTYPAQMQITKMSDSYSQPEHHRLMAQALVLHYWLSGFFQGTSFNATAILLGENSVMVSFLLQLEKVVLSVEKGLVSCLFGLFNWNSNIRLLLGAWLLFGSLRGPKQSSFYCCCG